MKIEDKQLVLGEKIAKIMIFSGLFLYLFGTVVSGGVLTIIAGIFGLIAIVAYTLKIFLSKGEKILKLLVIFGGLGYFFFISLTAVIAGPSYTLSITMMVLAFLILAGLIYEAVKKNLEKYEKFFPGLIVFLYGFFIGLTFTSGFVAWRNVFPILAVIIIALGVALYLAIFYFKGITSSKQAE